jgi:hypothetical protein
METRQFTAPRAGKVFLGLAIVGALGCVYTAFVDKTQFAYSYLTAFVFFICLSLGGLLFVLLQHLTRAGWSVVVRRIAENIASNLQWMWILAVPLIIALFFTDLFHWSHAEAVEHDPILHAKAGYFNKVFFLARATLFFGIWFLLSRYFLKKSVEQDKTGDKNLTLMMQKWATVGMILYVLTETFFSFDWVMSLYPHWFSTIFGVYFFCCSAVGIFSLMIIIAVLLRRNGFLRDMITVEHYHDLGKLLFGFNMFWAYIAFCQFLLIWYGNLGEETPFFHMRAAGSWKALSVAIPFIHFVIPFFFMISRNVKRNIPALTVSAVWLFIVNYIDIYWLIMPNYHQEGIRYGIGDISSMCFVGGLYFYFLLRQMEKSPLIPEKDPRLSESLKFINA